MVCINMDRRNITKFFGNILIEDKFKGINRLL